MQKVSKQQPRLARGLLANDGSRLGMAVIHLAWAIFGLLFTLFLGYPFPREPHLLNTIAWGIVLSLWLVSLGITLWSGRRFPAGRLNYLMAGGIALHYTVIFLGNLSAFFPSDQRIVAHVSVVVLWSAAIALLSSWLLTRRQAGAQA